MKQPQLVIHVHDPENAQESPHRYLFAQERVTIGRAPDNDLVLVSTGISKHHAVIEIVGAQLTVTDLESVNGVHLATGRISDTAAFSSGDELCIGPVPLVCVWNPARPANVEPAHTQEAPMIALHIHHEDGRVTPFCTRGSTVRIGRSDENDVVLLRGSASRHHASIMRKDGRLYVQDHQSSNGTFLNDARIQGSHPFGFGDELHIGKVRIRLDEDAMRPDEDESTHQYHVGELSRAAAEDAETHRMVESLRAESDEEIGALAEPIDEEGVVPPAVGIPASALPGEGGSSTLQLAALPALEGRDHDLLLTPDSGLESVRTTQPLSALGKAEIEQDRIAHEQSHAEDES